MRKNIILITVIVVVVLLIFTAMYVYNIYEVVISVTPKELFADSQSTVTIEAYPINAFGWRIPFRSVKTKFEITEGKQLVETVLTDSKNGKMILKSKNNTGIVILKVTPEKSLLPSEITIPVHPNLVLNENKKQTQL